MRRTLCSLCIALLVTACARGTSGPATALPAPSSADDVQTVLALEQLPAELTIDHFRTMRLSGTGLTLESVETRNAIYTRHRISYRSNGLRITGILNVPAGKGPFPLVILNHGYIDPAVYTQGRGLKREQDALARAGFAVLHTDYRGHAGSDKSPMAETGKIYDGGLEYAMDSANAINAVRAAGLPAIDSSKIGMLGHSLGGGVTLTILTGRPDLVDAAVLYAPVHADMWENFSRWRRERDASDRTLEVLKTREENPAAWDALSPETYLSSIRAPVLLLHGSDDRDVPKTWSDHLAARLREEGKDITYIEYAGERHEFGTEWADFMARTIALFRERLSP